MDRNFVWLGRLVFLRVASITEAWIETGPIQLAKLSEHVASITEAWIETPKSSG